MIMINTHNSFIYVKSKYPVHRMKSGCGSIFLIALMAETTSDHGASQL